MSFVLKLSKPFMEMRTLISNEESCQGIQYYIIYIYSKQIVMNLDNYFF